MQHRALISLAPALFALASCTLESDIETAGTAEIGATADVQDVAVAAHQVALGQFANSGITDTFTWGHAAIGGINSAGFDPNTPNPLASPTTPAGKLVNGSGRGKVGAGNDILIGGFVISGSTPKTVAIVATGPSLAQYGIASPLANPSIDLVRASDGALLGSNDNWQDAGNARQIAAGGFAPPHPLESAILVTLPPGAYTVLVRGVGGVTGTGIVGIYEAPTAGETSVLSNLSARGQVLTGNDILIGGFFLSATTTVAIQAAGPSLGAFGIVNPLPNPTLTLVRSSDQAPIATNDDWQSGPRAPELIRLGLAPSHPLESAILVTLEQGAYTLHVYGVGGQTGIGTVGIYALGQP